MTAGYSCHHGCSVSGVPQPLSPKRLKGLGGQIQIVRLGGTIGNCCPKSIRHRDLIGIIIMVNICGWGDAIDDNEGSVLCGAAITQLS